MPGDYTRFTFDALKNHVGVLMQQGRVMLDADFNEFVEILRRRMQASDLDTLGPCVVPLETPTGFQITIPSSGQIAIGPGRAYVHGILAENFGDPAGDWAWDPHLAEERGTTPVPFTEQPHYPGASLPEGNGPFVVYLDVWEREVTHLEDPDILEKAVGVDTATRLQTVWQVRTLDLSNAPDATCTGELPGWDAETASSAGRLTTEPVGVPQDTDPCAVNPTGGFRGTENRLYRVEVHDPGGIGNATFKWSRDNASVAARVREINGDEIRVSRTGRDDVLRFSPNDWIEVIDDHLELTQEPGYMRRVLVVDDVTETITLDDPLPPGVFDATDATRYTRIRKWDQKGQVLDGTGTVVADVEADGGVIPITGAAEYVLEDGVHVTFSTADEGDEFHVGDYWVFEARTVDASIQKLDEAPPRGIHHHYCRLAIVTFPDGIDDCRTFWPPDSGGVGCDCTVCVTAELHNSGDFTIQMAIDQAAGTGGKVCLGPGLYGVTEPIRITGGLSFQLEGHGWGTSLWYGGEGAAIRVRGSFGVDISRISVITYSRGDVGRPPIQVQNSFMVGVERCVLVHFGDQVTRGGSCVALNGTLGEVRVRNNVMFGTQGVDTLLRHPKEELDPDNPLTIYAATMGVYLDDNLIWATQRGVGLNGLCFHLGDTRVSGNTFLGGSDAAVRATGYVMPVSRVDIVGNEIATNGHGVVVGEDNVRVADNDISAFGQPQSDTVVPPTGVWITRGEFATPIQRCAVKGNRIVGMSGDGILIDTAVGSAMIKSNVIEAIGRNGINMDGEAQAQVISIENNHILAASTSNEGRAPVSAIRALNATQGEIVSNTIRDFALAAVQNSRRTGIEVVAVHSIRIAGNDIQGVGPTEGFVGSGAGIVVAGPYDRVDVLDNSVLRHSGTRLESDGSQWYGLLITLPAATRPGLVATVIETMGEAALYGVSAGAPAARSRSRGRAIVSYAADNEIAASAYDDYVIATLVGITVLPRGRHIVAVRGNLIEAYGRSPAVDVLTSGICTFNDNRCLQTPQENANPRIVDVDAAAAIANANYLERPTPNPPLIGLDINVSTGPFTLVGNICTGPIHINGAQLDPGSPWAPLNVVV